MEPGHHGADRRLHDLRDLLVGKALHVGEVDGEAELLGEALQGVLHLGVGQVLERLHLRGLEPGRRVRLGPGELPVLDVLGHRLLRLALLLAVGVDEGVGQDAVEPGLEVGAGPELLERAVRLRERLLDQVLGVGGVAGHPHRGGVQLVEERQRVALEARGAVGLGLRRHVDLGGVHDLEGLFWGVSHRLPIYCGGGAIHHGEHVTWNIRPRSGIPASSHLMHFR